jgi:L-histidine Nalpha-methyltransferase
VSPTETSSHPTLRGSSPAFGSPGISAEQADLRLFQEVARGLRETPRRLPPKLFYDARGAELFEAITRLPEYYPTRTELAILADALPQVARRVGTSARIVEFGSGSGDKTAELLRALEFPSELILVDIAADQLRAVADGFQRDHPGLRVRPVLADYTLPWRLPEPDPASGRTLFFFPGSTIGNFEPHEARGFLANMAQAGGSRASLLLGADLEKPREVLEPAYDDASGVTAAFNRNALSHLNARLGANFDPEAFRHEAPWNARESRIEMRLVSHAHQRVRIAPELPGVEPLLLELGEGEAIVTEHSYKFRPARIEGLARSGGWRSMERWTDPRDWFEVRYLER